MSRFAVEIIIALVIVGAVYNILVEAKKGRKDNGEWKKSVPVERQEKMWRGKGKHSTEEPFRAASKSEGHKITGSRRVEPSEKRKRDDAKVDHRNSALTMEKGRLPENVKNTRDHYEELEIFEEPISECRDVNEEEAMDDIQSMKKEDEDSVKECSSQYKVKKFKCKKCKASSGREDTLVNEDNDGKCYYGV